MKLFKKITLKKYLYLAMVVFITNILGGCIFNSFDKQPIVVTTEPPVVNITTPKPVINITTPEPVINIPIPTPLKVKIIQPKKLKPRIYKDVTSESFKLSVECNEVTKEIIFHIMNKKTINNFKEKYSYDKEKYSYVTVAFNNDKDKNALYGVKELTKIIGPLNIKNSILHINIDSLGIMRPVKRPVSAIKKSRNSILWEKLITIIKKGNQIPTSIINKKDKTLTFITKHNRIPAWAEPSIKSSEKQIYAFILPFIITDEKINLGDNSSSVLLVNWFGKKENWNASYYLFNKAQTAEIKTIMGLYEFL